MAIVQRKFSFIKSFVQQKPFTAMVSWLEPRRGITKSETNPRQFTHTPLSSGGGSHERVICVRGIGVRGCPVARRPVLLGTPDTDPRKGKSLQQGPGKGRGGVLNWDLGRGRLIIGSVEIYCLLAYSNHIMSRCAWEILGKFSLHHTMICDRL